MDSRGALADYEVRATRSGVVVGRALQRLLALKRGAIPRARYLADAEGPEALRARGAWLAKYGSALHSESRTRDLANALAEAAETANGAPPFDYADLCVVCETVGDLVSYGHRGSFDFAASRARIELMIAELTHELSVLMDRALLRAAQEALAYQEVFALRCAERGVPAGDAGVLAEAGRELDDLFAELESRALREEVEANAGRARGERVNTGHVAQRAS